MSDRAPLDARPLDAHPTDVRLVPAALTAWLVTALGILTPLAPVLTVAGVLAAVAVLVVRRRLPARATAVVLAMVVVGTGFAAAITLRTNAVRDHPLAEHYGGTAEVTLTPSENPRPLGNGRDAEVLGRSDELPGELDGVALEVVAEREIAEHLEEGVVTAGQPDLFEVVVLPASAHALLAGDRADIAARVLPEEGALELHHAGVGEEQRRVVGGNEGRRGDLGVTLGDEIVEESAANLGGIHGAESNQPRPVSPPPPTAGHGRWPRPRPTPGVRRRPATDAAWRHG